jgi:hypothetical protein
VILAMEKRIFGSPGRGPGAGEVLQVQRARGL